MVLSRRVCYYYDDEVGNYHYGPGHPWKPQVVRMAHSLIRSYNLLPLLAETRPESLTGVVKDMMRFHCEDFIRFLQSVEGREASEMNLQILFYYNIGLQCPIFDGLFDYCKSYTAGSAHGARKLCAMEADVVINWSGGMSKAKSRTCAAVAPVNDVVISILILLQKFEKVLYVDMDAEHCSGVEEAFYGTNKVLTLSLHEKTSTGVGGLVDDIGVDAGAGYSINVPLNIGTTDEEYIPTFQKVVTDAYTAFQPQVIVLQAGANVLAGDRLSNLNLSVEGFGSCIGFMNTLVSCPMLVLGGSGSTLRNAARAWAYATSVLVGKELPNDIPNSDDYYEHYSPDYNLRYEVYPAVVGVDNDCNTEENDDGGIRKEALETFRATGSGYLDSIVETAQNNLRKHVVGTKMKNRIEVAEAAAPAAPSAGETGAFQHNNDAGQ